MKKLFGRSIQGVQGLFGECNLVVLLLDLVQDIRYACKNLLLGFGFSRSRLTCHFFFFFWWTRIVKCFFLEIFCVAQEKEDKKKTTTKKSIRGDREAVVA